MGRPQYYQENHSMKLLEPNLLFAMSFALMSFIHSKELDPNPEKKLKNRAVIEKVGPDFFWERTLGTYSYFGGGRFKIENLKPKAIY